MGSGPGGPGLRLLCEPRQRPAGTMTVTSAQARAPTSGGDWNLKCGNCHGEPAAAFFPHAAGQKAAGGVALCCLRVATPTRGRPQISLK